MSLTPVIIDRLKDMGIPTTSFTEAAYYVRDVSNHKAAGIKSNFDKYIRVLTNRDVPTRNLKDAELTFGYLVQESVRHFNMKEYLEIEQCIELAQKKAAEFLKKNPWLDPEVVEAKNAADVALAIEAGVTAKKPRVSRASGMSKKDRCIALYNQNIEAMPDKHQIIELFMKELGLSKPGATTYEYNLRKGVWK